MNYLAHIHLAHTTKTSLVGNFLGDFVKGSDLTHLPRDIQKGVRLHRSIDSFTDSHNCVEALRNTFPRSIRRMSGVVIDLYFDHLLSVHWEHYNTTPMSSMLAVFYQQLESSNTELGDRFSKVKIGLLQYKWLHEYDQKEAVIRAFYRIEMRLKHKVTFAAEASDFISQNHSEMSEAFSQFYPQLIRYCQEITD